MSTTTVIAVQRSPRVRVDTKTDAVELYRDELFILREWNQDLFESLVTFIDSVMVASDTTEVFNLQKVLVTRLCKDKKTVPESSKQVGVFLRLLCKIDKDSSHPHMIIAVVRVLFEHYPQEFFTALIDQEDTWLLFQQFSRKAESVQLARAISFRIRKYHLTAVLENLRTDDDNDNKGDAESRKVVRCINLLLPPSTSSWMINFGSYHSRWDKRPSIELQDKELIEAILQTLHHWSAAATATGLGNFVNNDCVCWQGLHKLTVQGRLLTDASTNHLLAFMQSPSCRIRGLTMVRTGVEEAVARVLRLNDSVEMLKMCTDLRDNSYSTLLDILDDALRNGKCTLTNIWLGNPSHAIDLSDTNLPYWCSLNLAGRAKLRQEEASVEDLLNILQYDHQIQILYGLLRDNPNMWSNVC